MLLLSLGTTFENFYRPGLLCNVLANVSFKLQFTPALELLGEFFAPCESYATHSYGFGCKRLPMCMKRYFDEASSTLPPLKKFSNILYTCL